MAYAESPLAGEIDFVVSNTEPVIRKGYAMVIKTPKGEFDQFKVTSIDTIESYTNSYAPIMTIEAYMGLGLYSKQIYPERENLEITLISYDRSKPTDIEFQTYRGILIESSNPAVDEQAVQNLSEFTMDLSSLVPVQFQLESAAIEQLRMVTIGGTYRQRTMSEVLETVLTIAIGQVDLDDSQLPQGVDIAGEPNDEVFEQVIIPHGTPLYKVPNYLQAKQFGLYSAGVGHFFKDHTWFVFPPYDTERFNDGNDTLNVSLVPANMMMGVDRSYRRVGGTTMILCAGERQIDTVGEKAKIVKGEGVRFADPDKMFNDWLDTTTQNNKAVASRGTGMSEFVMEGEERENTNAPMSSTPITGNKLVQLSELASRKGSYFTCEWLHADPDILRPCMMARIKYIDQGLVRMFEGCLVGIQVNTRLLGKGIQSKSYGSSVAMTFFVQRDLDQDVTDI